MIKIAGAVKLVQAMLWIPYALMVLFPVCIVKAIFGQRLSD